MTSKPAQGRVYRGLVTSLAVVLLVSVSLMPVGLGEYVSLVQPAVAAASADSWSQLGSGGEVPASGTNKVYLPVVLKVAKPPAQPPTVFGVQMYEHLDTPGAALNLAQAAKVSWVRWPIGWAGVEPQDTSPDHYNWTAIDASLEAASAAGLKVIVTIDGNPSWAATYPGGHLDRSGVGPFVEFVGALVERYDGDGQNDAPGSPSSIIGSFTMNRTAVMHWPRSMGAATGVTSAPSTLRCCVQFSLP